MDRELDFEEREVVLRADLRDRDEDDCIWTAVRFLMRGPRPPREGESVVLVDVQGGTCVGHVTSVTGWEACVRPDWETWDRAELPPARREVKGRTAPDAGTAPPPRPAPPQGPAPRAL
jgi:hypothetical protein